MWRGDIHIELRVLAHVSDRARKGIPGMGNSMSEGDGSTKERVCSRNC